VLECNISIQFSKSPLPDSKAPSCVIARRVVLPRVLLLETPCGFALEAFAFPCYDSRVDSWKTKELKILSCQYCSVASVPRFTYMNRGTCRPGTMASRFECLDIAKLLLDHGADMDAQKLDDWTPLHLAVGNHYLEIVEVLLEQRARVDLLNDKGRTPPCCGITKGCGGYRGFAVHVCGPWSVGHPLSHGTTDVVRYLVLACSSNRIYDIHFSVPTIPPSSEWLK
jgi:hypothetical protein